MEALTADDTETLNEQTRVEVMVYYTKMLEAIVPSLKDADHLWHEWCEMRHAAGLPMGGACFHLVRTGRSWNVGVGETHPEPEEKDRWRFTD